MRARTEATVARTSVLSGPTGLVVACLAALLLWRFGPGTPEQAALLAIAALFLCALRKPVWAMAAFLVSFLTINDHMIGGSSGSVLSVRLFLVALALAVVLLWRFQGRWTIELGPMAKRILVPAIVLVALATVSNLINLGGADAFRDSRQLVLGLLIVILLATVVRTSKELKILLGVALVVLTASGAIAIMQHYDVLGMSQYTLTSTSSAMFDDNRSSGVAEDALQLGFVLASALPILAAVYLSKGVKGKTTWVLAASGLLMGLGLYFTYTRSAVLGLVVGAIALIPLIDKRRRGVIILAFLIVGLAFFVITSAHGNRYSSSSDSSAVSREVYREAGVAIALDHPIFGIGAYNFPAASRQYASVVNQESLRQSDLGSDQPHNDFVGLAVSYGIPTLVVYIWLSVAVLLGLLASYRVSRARFTKAVAMGLIAAIFAYMVNAYYHNCLATMPLFWVLVGLSLATTKVALAKSRRAHERTSPRLSNGLTDTERWLVILPHIRRRRYGEAAPEAQ